ncbi:MAG TPA: hypothetical protein VMU49_06315 [Candidatus Acidoferrales bacterium]|nr:hypothetical protein [Candidatus Acidoferrales bacterium]
MATFDFLSRSRRLVAGVLSGLLAGLLAAWIYFGIAGVTVAQSARMQPPNIKSVCQQRYYCIPIQRIPRAQPNLPGGSAPAQSGAPSQSG